MERQYLEKQLNTPEREKRLESVRELAKMLKSGEIIPEKGENDVNNHIHTTYSFSPYSPSAAVYYGYMAGLSTVGIMDHDSVCGCEEFIEAAKIIGIAATCGLEVRVKMDGTPFEGRKTNCPDQTITYCSLHGIPHTQFGVITGFLKPYTLKRNERNAKIIENLNTLLNPYGIFLDFEKDVVPLSMFYDGGSITERHVLYAASIKIIEKFGKGARIVDFMRNGLKISVSEKIAGYLCDIENPHYIYDILGVLKSDVTNFYVDADEECPHITEIVKLAEKTGSIMAYPYLGDIKESVTGDKRAQKFEDDFLEEILEYLKDTGFKSITYMPSRNTIEQLRRLRSLCEKLGFFQISGEDINTSRQSFICMAQRNPEFANLQDAAWALIGHEEAATKNIEDGFCTAKTIALYPAIDERIKHFKKFAIDIVR